MKSVAATLMIMLITVITITAQEQSTQEEQSLIDLIQEHYDHWKNRDFEKWTTLWVHEDYVGYTSLSPNNFFDVKGWDAVSTVQKNSMNNNALARPDVDFGQFDYTFVIRDNMAMVKFIGESNLRTTSVFEKVEGSWKYILNEQVNKTGYDLNAELKKLESFEGNWQMVPGSFKWENPDNGGEIIRYVMDITQSSTGIDINTKFNFRNAQQNIWRGKESISVIKDSPSGKLIHTLSNHFSNNGWTNNGFGETELSDQAITLHGTRVNNENNTYNIVIQRGSADQIHISSTNPSGQKWSVEMKLVE